ncbi:MAG: hypothetical protein R3B47_11135 [Bacteroidia bacterium]
MKNILMSFMLLAGLLVWGQDDVNTFYGPAGATFWLYLSFLQTTDTAIRLQAHMIIPSTR